MFNVSTYITVIRLHYLRVWHQFIAELRAEITVYTDVNEEVMYERL